MASLSKVKICNMALANIGAKSTIESLTEESTEAKACNLFYDQARLLSLEANDWGFARKRQALALDSEDPPDGVWGYRYQYPADCVVARQLENPTVVNQSIIRGVPTTLIEPDAIPYRIEISDDGERKTILTDLEDATLVYTFDQEVVSMFPRHFVIALSYALSHMIAFKLTGKVQIQDLMAQRFEQMIMAAGAHDGNENVARAPRDADWIRGRY